MYTCRWWAQGLWVEPPGTRWIDLRVFPSCMKMWYRLIISLSSLPVDSTWPNAVLKQSYFWHKILTWLSILLYWIHVFQLPTQKTVMQLYSLAWGILWGCRILNFYEYSWNLLDLIKELRESKSEYLKVLATGDCCIVLCQGLSVEGWLTESKEREGRNPLHCTHRGLDILSHGAVAIQWQHSAFGAWGLPSG